MIAETKDRLDGLAAHTGFRSHEMCVTDAVDVEDSAAMHTLRVSQAHKELLDQEHHQLPSLKTCCQACFACCCIDDSKEDAEAKLQAHLQRKKAQLDMEKARLADLKRAECSRSLNICQTVVAMPCMIYGCICYHSTISCSDITMCCDGKGECLCCVAEDCCIAGADHKGIGLVKTREGEICRLALPCCARALKTPTVLCSGAEKCLCCYTVCSLPFDKDYVPAPVCAWNGITCAPTPGCCTDPPYSAAIDKPKGGGTPASGSPDGAEMAR